MDRTSSIVSMWLLRHAGTTSVKRRPRHLRRGLRRNSGAGGGGRRSLKISNRCVLLGPASAHHQERNHDNRNQQDPDPSPIGFRGFFTCDHNRRIRSSCRRLGRGCFAHGLGRRCLGHSGGRGCLGGRWCFGGRRHGGCGPAAGGASSVACTSFSVRISGGPGVTMVAVNWSPFLQLRHLNPLALHDIWTPRLSSSLCVKRRTTLLGTHGDGSTYLARDHTLLHLSHVHRTRPSWSS